MDEGVKSIRNIGSLRGGEHEGGRRGGKEGGKRGRKAKLKVVNTQTRKAKLEKEKQGQERRKLC